METRRKRTCWGCRAVTVSAAGAECAIGYVITLPAGEFYRPGPGQICPKPATFGRLTSALRGDRDSGGGTRENQVQMSLL